MSIPAVLTAHPEPFAGDAKTGAPHLDPFRARVAALDAVFGRHSSVYREAASFIDGGPVAFAEFPQYLPKTVIYCTCELTGADEDGRVAGQLPCSTPARSGQYEILIALPITSKLVPRRHQAGITDHGVIGHILRDLALLSTQAEFASGAVVPLTEPSITPVSAALIVDISSTKHPFTHAGAEHSLLLAMFIHPRELDYCRQEGHRALVKLLREAGVYPVSDHRRASVL